MSTFSLPLKYRDNVEMSDIYGTYLTNTMF